MARGPHSLQTLRFLRSLGGRFLCTLGNHDLHLLALAAGHPPRRADASLAEVLAAPDLSALCRWLRHQPLLHQCGGQLIVHAGIPPQWSAQQAAGHAAQVQDALRGADADGWLLDMHGDEPAQWSRGLRGHDRLRYITNALTRMRFCTADGGLELRCKGAADAPPPGAAPWFAHSGRRARGVHIIFGHWAALGGDTGASPNVTALDTGCVWGGSLSLMRLADGHLLQTPKDCPGP